MKKVIIIFLAVGLILSCKLLDQKDDQKADIRINVSLNNTEIDEAILVIYDIDYSYTTVSNNYENKNIHFSFPSTNFEKYWVTGVEDELDNLSNNNCAVESRQDLSISNIEAIGNFEIEAGIKYFLVGLFSNNNLVSTGYSDIVELQSGELKTINISPYKINTAPKAFFSIDPPYGTTATIFTFDARGSSDNEDVSSALEVRWDTNGDSNWDTGFSTKQIESFQYSSSGIYNVILNVKDTGGMTDKVAKSISVYNPDDVINFPDSGFENIIREILNKPVGDILKTELQVITVIEGDQREIHNISGIENCISLKRLSLAINQISNIAKLEDLTQLEHLNLENNLIDNIDALSNLHNIQTLHLNDNLINNISSLIQNTGIGLDDYIEIQRNQINYINEHIDILDLKGRGVNVLHSDHIVTDLDGNIYNTIEIGNQLWMIENLKVTHYQNGESIPNITDGDEWAHLNSGAYCNYSNQDSFVTKLGRLYNWYSINDPRGIAPEGWHVPSDEEWKELELFIGMDPSVVNAYGSREAEVHKLKAIYGWWTTAGIQTKVDSLLFQVDSDKRTLLHIILFIIGMLCIGQLQYKVVIFMRGIDH